MKIRNPTLNRLLARGAARLLTVWLRTCRVEAHCGAGTSPFAGRLGEPGNATTSRRLGGMRTGDGPHVHGFYPFWHEWIVPYVFARPHASMAGLISQHRDGGYLADAMTAVGLKTVRGSTSRGGAAAVRQILDECGAWDLGITPDGPRGPRRELKTGVAFLASRTGRPIVPTAVACSSAWVLKGNWTDLVLPKPFSRIVFCGGPPIYLPADADREELNARCRRIESAIAAQESRAGVIADGHADPGTPETEETDPADADTAEFPVPARRAA